MILMKHVTLPTFLKLKALMKKKVQKYKYAQYVKENSKIIKHWVATNQSHTPIRVKLIIVRWLRVNKIKNGLKSENDLFINIVKLIHHSI